MGLQLPERSAVAVRRPRRLTLLIMLGIGLVALSGCGTDSEFERFAAPEPITTQAEANLGLWQGAWIAALFTGAVVWGLIFFVSWRYRRRSADEVPIQTRYNLPLEIFYTIFPIIMVIVFFDHTVRVQNVMLEEETKPDQTIYVVGQQWQWTFNYPEAVDGQNVYEFGTGDYIPTLVLPVDSTTRFELRSPDVIHNFGVPGFLMRMDVIPGQENAYQVTPTETGTFTGKCYELCGAYHSRMIFNVEVVERDEYEARLEELAELGNTSEKPICGGENADTQVGITTEDSEDTCQ